jgi:hypothetical protein
MTSMPPTFWYGVGAAIIGSALSGLIAVGAAFLAAALARRHDRLQSARQACARLGVVAFDVMSDLLSYSRHDHLSLVRDRLGDLHKAYLVESAYFTDMRLAELVDDTVTWLRGEWEPALERTHHSLPEPFFDEVTGQQMQDISSLRRMAQTGADALSGLAAVLAVWQRDQVVETPPPFPQLPHSGAALRD